MEGGNKYYYEKYGKAIVAKYRERGIKRFGREFYSERGKNTDSSGGKYPTFWEFVTAILETGVLVY